jgi:hypothetical protein
MYNIKMEKKMKNITLLIILGFLAGSLSGCATDATPDPNYKPGMDMSLIGGYYGGAADFQVSPVPPPRR